MIKKIVGLTALSLLVAISCSKKEDKTIRGKDITSQVLPTLEGKFLDETGESVTIYADGQVELLQVKNISISDDATTTIEEPCSFIRIGHIDSIFLRSGKNRNRNKDFATHEVDIVFHGFKLSDELEAKTTSSTHCQKFKMKEISALPNNHTMLAEIMTSDHIRLHTYDDGTHKMGIPKNETLLDENFFRLSTDLEVEDVDDDIYKDNFETSLVLEEDIQEM